MERDGESCIELEKATKTATALGPKAIAYIE